MNKPIFYICIIIIGLALAGCETVKTSPSASRLPIVAIVNNTGFDCYSLYVKPVTDEDWGIDLLRSSILPKGESFRIRLSIPLNIINRYDIRMVDSDDDTYTKYRLELANGSNIVFTNRDSDNY